MEEVYPLRYLACDDNIRFQWKEDTLFMKIQQAISRTTVLDKSLEYTLTMLHIFEMSIISIQNSTFYITLAQ